MGQGLGSVGRRPRSAWEAGMETPGRPQPASCCAASPLRQSGPRGSCPVWYLAGVGVGQGSDSPPVQQGQRPSQV